MRRLVDVNLHGHALRRTSGAARRSGGRGAATSSPCRRSSGAAASAGSSVYSATKAAQIGFIEALCAPSSSAADLHASVIYPVATDTEFRDAIASRLRPRRRRARPAPVAPTKSRDRSSTASSSPKAEVYPYRQGLVARRAQRRRAGDDGSARATIQRGDVVPPEHGRWRLRRLTSRSAIARGGSRRRRPRAARRRLRARRAAGPAAEGPRPRGVRRRRRIDCATLLDAIRPGRDGRRELRRLQDRRHRRLASRAASRRRAAATRVSPSTGDPSLSIEEAARRRDFTINAISRDPLTGRDPRSVRRPARSRRAPPARRRPGDVWRRQPARAARAAVRRAVRAHDRRGHARALPVDPARRSPGRAHLGRGREAAASGRAGRRSASRSRSISASSIGCGRSCEALVGCPQEPEWHPEGDVWVHTLMVVDQARQRIDDLDRGRARRDDARRGLPRPRQAGDDGGDRRPDPIARDTKKPASHRRRRSSID